MSSSFCAQAGIRLRYRSWLQCPGRETEKREIVDRLSVRSVGMNKGRIDGGSESSHPGNKGDRASNPPVLTGVGLLGNNAINRLLRF